MTYDQRLSRVGDAPETWNEVDLNAIDIALLDPEDEARPESEPTSGETEEEGYPDAEDKLTPEPAEQQQNPEPEDGKHGS